MSLFDYVVDGRLIGRGYMADQLSDGTPVQHEEPWVPETVEDLKESLVRWKKGHASLVEQLKEAEAKFSKVNTELSRREEFFKVVVSERNENARRVQDLERQYACQVEGYETLSKKYHQALADASEALRDLDDYKVRLRVTERAVVSLALVMSSSMAIQKPEDRP